MSDALDETTDSGSVAGVPVRPAAYGRPDDEDDGAVGSLVPVK